MQQRLVHHAQLARHRRDALGAMKVAEARFAFRMARDRAPRDVPYSVDEVMSAVGALRPVIGIPDSRCTGCSLVAVARLVADSACASWLATGRAAGPDWRAVDARFLKNLKGAAQQPGLTGC